MNTALKVSPRNLLEWSNMEDWVDGASAAPTNHTLTGASATVARESTIVKQGTYSARVTRVGTDCTLYYDHPDYTLYPGRQMTFGCWVYATVASRARISLGDGVGTSNSSYHTGDSTWQYLSVTRNVDTAATRIRVGMEVNTGNTSGYFDGGVLIEGATSVWNLSDYMDVADYKPSRRFRLTKYVVARRAGSIIPRTEYGDKGITITGRVIGATATAARTSIDTLSQAISGRELDLFLYDDRFIRAFLESFDNDPTAALRVFDVNMKFAAQSPFYQSLQRYRGQQAISSSPTTFTVTSAGNVFTKPVLLFVAGGSDITSCTLENLTTGQTFSFTGTVTAGNTLEVDCENTTVENNAVDSVSSFVGDFLRLDPGANQMKFTGSNCTVKVDYYDRFL